MNEYEIKYTTAEMTLGCRVKTNAELVHFNEILKQELMDLRESNKFLTIEDIATGLVSNVKAIKVIGFVVKEIRTPEMIDAEIIEQDDDMEDIEYE